MTAPALIDAAKARLLSIGFWLPRHVREPEPAFYFAESQRRIEFADGAAGDSWARRERSFAELRTGMVCLDLRAQLDISLMLQYELRRLDPIRGIGLLGALAPAKIGRDTEAQPVFDQFENWSRYLQEPN